MVAVIEIVDVLTQPGAAAFAPWFFGPLGFVLANLRPFSDAGPGEGLPGRARTRLVLYRATSNTSCEFVPLLSYSGRRASVGATACIAM